MQLELRPTAARRHRAPGCAARQLRRGVGRAGGRRGRFSVRWMGEERLPPAIETTLYRVAQEALPTNVLKHAAARRVVWSFKNCPASCRSSWKTTGRADSDAHVGVGQPLGILGMQERAALVGGTLTIESGIGSITDHRSRSASGLRRTAVSELQVFLVDDHAVLREGLKALVRHKPAWLSPAKRAMASTLASGFRPYNRTWS